MRYLLFYLLLATATLSAQNSNVSFRSTLPYPGQTLANVWGYAAGGREYALVGAQNGVSIVDVTDPANPVQIVQIPGPASGTGGNLWHEIKTYSHYAYAVSEGGLGLQIIDLTNLPGSNLAYQSYYGNGGGAGLTKAHALHIDETKGYLYLYGSNLFNGKPVVLNLNSDPYNPTYVNYVNFVGYAHDGYVNNDILYGAHIYAGLFSVVNMANKTNPVLLATQSTPGAFTHNTWASGSTVFTTDEINGSFLAAYDVSNTSNITLLDKIQSNPGSNSMVHNTHILNNYAITSWYKDGITITDVARPANLVQVGNYDTYPSGSGANSDGDWGVYPYLPSGNLLATVITGPGNQGELWVLTPNYIRGCYLEGLITNANTGLPLNAAKVELLSTSTAENSGSNGLYKMGQVQDGGFTARVSKAGFITQDFFVNLTNGVLTTLNVALAPASLPVELTDFTARPEHRLVRLRWATATETDNAGFEVQHSTDGLDWQVLGFVPAQGNGLQPAAYAFRTAELPAGRHFFRLRQTDLQGSSQLSPVRSVEIIGSGLRATLQPNVIRDGSMLHLETGDPGQVQLEIFQSDGRSTGLHWAFTVEQTADWPLTLSPLPAGIYFLVVRTERERLTLPLVKE